MSKETLKMTEVSRAEYDEYTFYQASDSKEYATGSGAAVESFDGRGRLIAVKIAEGMSATYSVAK